jgi:hypothetical protein
MSKIPFQLPDIGLREIHGAISLDEEFLVLEVEESLAGEFDKEQFMVKIEPAALAAIRLERGIVRDRICIRPKTRDLLAVVPGEYAHELQLKVWVTRRADAGWLVHEVQRRQRTASAERV